MEEKEFDEVGEKLHQQVTKLANQLGGWTMAANAGGLAFILTAARDTNIARALPLDGAYLTFLVGLLCGFVGHVSWLLAGIVTVNAVASASAAKHLLDDRQARRVKHAAERLEIPEYWDELDVENRKSVEKSFLQPAGLVLGAAGALLYIAAAGCALGGLATPLTLGIL